VQLAGHGGELEVEDRSANRRGQHPALALRVASVMEVSALLN